jgi:hypothetical protein
LLPHAIINAAKDNRLLPFSQYIFFLIINEPLKTRFIKYSKLTDRIISIRIRELVVNSQLVLLPRPTESKLQSFMPKIVKTLQNHFQVTQEEISISTEEMADLRIVNISNEWKIIILSAQSSIKAHSKNFESAIELLLDIDRNHLPIEKLCLIIDVNAILKGERNSYWRSMKKYSNSVIFEDIGIQMLLYANDEIVLHAVAEDVNDVLNKLEWQLKIIQ